MDKDKARNQQQQAQHPGASTSPSQQQGGDVSSQSQQDQYSPSSPQQGGALSRRRGDLPSRWSGHTPFDLVRQLDEDMERLWNQLWGGGRSRSSSSARSGDGQPMWMPPLEVFERDGKLHVHADLPGMRKEDIKLHIEQEQLVISGERRSQHEQDERDKGGYWHSERSYGSFYRTVPLPDGVNPATAQANFKDGVLDVSFDAPKRPPSQKRSIDIK